MGIENRLQIKLYFFNGTFFELEGIIDDYEECSFESNCYSAGQFTIQINYNIPNAQMFRVGRIVQFGNSPYKVGEILSITDNVGAEGKGSQSRIITGYDLRYIYKRRIISSLNTADTWQMTGPSEECMRKLILSQTNTAERSLPIINNLPENYIGNTYSVNEQFSNLYEVLCNIATQTETCWRVVLHNGELTLEIYKGNDLHEYVIISSEMDSLADGVYTNSKNNFTNATYIGGKGTGADRDIYLGEVGSPQGLGRFESWQNQSSLTTENEYQNEANSILTQYSQTVEIQGNALIKSPFIFGEAYNVGDIVLFEINNIRNSVPVISVNEHWAKSGYELSMNIGKPVPSLNNQLNVMLKQIQKASNKNSGSDSVRWYTIPTDEEMPRADIIYNTIGFVGTTTDSSFKLYLDNEKNGSKTYHVYIKQLAGDSLTLTTGFEGAQNVVLPAGTYVAIIYIDSEGNITLNSATPTNRIVSGSTLPATSGAVANAISNSGVPTGAVIPYYGIVDPQGWFICDGRDTTGTAYELSSHYPSLYALLNSNVLPDFRGEFIRGAGTNSHTNQGDGASVGVHQDATVLHPQTEFGHDIKIQNNDSTKITVAQGTHEVGNNASYTRTAYVFRPTNTSLNYIIKA